MMAEYQEGQQLRGSDGKIYVVRNGVPVTQGGIAGPDPAKVKQEQRADEDQQIQREAAIRSREDQSLQRERFEVDRQKASLDIQEKQKKLDDGDVGSAVGEERKAAAFLIRALGANDSYEG